LVAIPKHISIEEQKYEQKSGGGVFSDAGGIVGTGFSPNSGCKGNRGRTV
jgi:hypothetical protein